MTRYKRAYSKCTFCGIWPVFANPVTFVYVEVPSVASIIRHLRHVNATEGMCVCLYGGR